MTTIVQARKDESEKGQPNIEGRVFQRYLVELSNGEQTDILRKPDSPDPTGLEVEQKPNGRWKVSTGGGGGTSGDRGYGYQTHPEDAKRMGRCHAQDSALQAMTLAHKIGVTTVQGPMDGDEFRKRIKAWTDWFEKDANA